MALVVRADVVDIRADLPNPNDSFLVDTNVWYWLTYLPASQSAQPYQIQQYPRYLKRSTAVGASLRYCGTTFAELAHLIESAEYKSFCVRQGIQPNSQIKSKDFRHNYSNERQDVQDEVGISWGQVSAMASIVDVPLNALTINASATLFGQVCLDGYDLFTVEAMRQSGILKIITDDKDFLTVPDIIVLTANNSAIGAAQNAGKLRTRAA